MGHAGDKPTITIEQTLAAAIIRAHAKEIEVTIIVIVNPGDVAVVDATQGCQLI